MWLLRSISSCVNFHYSLGWLRWKDKAWKGALKNATKRCAKSLLVVKWYLSLLCSDLLLLETQQPHSSISLVWYNWPVKCACNVLFAACWTSRSVSWHQRVGWKMLQQTSHQCSRAIWQLEEHFSSFVELSLSMMHIPDAVELAILFEMSITSKASCIRSPIKQQIWLVHWEVLSNTLSQNGLLSSLIPNLFLRPKVSLQAKFVLVEMNIFWWDIFNLP